MSSRWSEQTKLIVGISGLVGLVWVVFRFANILLPLSTALILTYILNHPVGWVTRRTGWPRTLVVILHFLLLIAMIIWGSALLTPRLIRATVALGDSLTSLINELSPFFTRPVILFGFRFDLAAEFDQILGAVQGVISPLASEAVGMVVNIASGFFYLILILVLSFYLVKDTPRIMQFISRRIPLAYRDETVALWRELDCIWDAYFRGQLVLVTIIGVTVWLAMTIVGLPNALALGVIAGALEVIPNIGPVVASIPAILLALVSGASRLPLSNEGAAVVVTLIYVVIQQLENHFIVPRVIGTRVNLHPVVVITGTLGGAQLAGILGVFLAAPVIASVRILFSYVYAKILDLEPFAQIETLSPTPHRQQLGNQPVCALLFDLDGTLVETDDGLVRSWEKLLWPVRWLLPQRDVNAAARKLVVAFEGPFNRFMSLLDAVSLDHHAARLYRQVAGRFFSSTRRDFHVVAGAADAVRSLAGRYSLAIVTTRSTDEVADFLQQTGLGPCFKVVVTRDNTPRLKPHPLPVCRAAEQLGVPVEECAMVGDSTVDVQAAKSAGALAIGVLSGFGTPSTLVNTDLLLPSVAQLTDWL